MKRIVGGIFGLGIMMLVLGHSAWAGLGVARPALVASGTDLYTAWSVELGGSQVVVFKRSLNRGFSWSPQKQMTNSGAAVQPALAVSASGVFLAFTWSNAGETQVYVMRSLNRGKAWSNPVKLSNAVNWANNAAIAGSGSNVYVFWDQYEGSSWNIYWTKSTNNGGTWETVQPFRTNPGSRYDATLSALGQNVDVAWTEEGTGTDFIRSLDGGLSWQDYSSGLFSGIEEVVDCAPLMADLLWLGDSSDNYQILFAKSTDGGINWGSKVQVSSGLNYCEGPMLARSDETIYAVWQDPFIGNNQVFFAKSGDHGDKWRTARALTSAKGSANSPVVVAESSNVYVTWWDMVKTSYGYKVSLMMKKSQDRGMTWMPAKSIGRADIHL
jgi:hypothetical protein